MDRRKLKHSLEHRRKNSESKLGDKNPTKRLEVRQKLSKINKGRLNPNFKDGRWYEFNKLRKEKLEIVGFKCERCGISDEEIKEKGGKGLHGHHIDENPLHNVLENIKILCNSCHRNIHGGGLNSPKEGKASERK